ncbi:excinuclease ABC subunit UvrA [Anaerocolumna sp. AGMB13020]|uniref:excinuclease ABC subunit UvrA n=1 Tax=Anaerocolumna sp. AGMB13020 TaxID=3081750 RepID=UPI002953FCA6|nr:excinuclease ABC subunit UvrA [Anaerocolumna sp. AGMB13020]WOO36832.1 excinuclease ABC subunit UvrA [Anaerocolumna sp. AGMB13020]
MGKIRIKNAKEHNLKNVSIDIPKNKLVVFTGVSGSGKSTIVYDIVFSEAQRQYMDSLSTYARMSMPKFSKPDVEDIEGLSPAIVINQDPLAKNPRSTVGTVTEVYTYLRLLYSRMGQPVLSAGDFSFNTPSGACQNCKGTGEELVINANRLLDRTKSLNEGAIRHRTWKVGGRLWNIINAAQLFDMNKPLKDFTEEELDTLLYSEAKQYYNNTLGFVQNFSYEGIITRIMKRHNDSRGLEAVSYDGAFFLPGVCHECKGARVNERAREVRYNGKSIVDLVTMEIQELLPYMKTISDPVAQEITGYIIRILELLVDIGVGYLSLSRSVATLSNGESQRVKLGRQLGNSLTDLIYILDEPTAGLHAKDKEHISKALKELAKKPNSVLVVEHDKSVISCADHIIDIGPKAGVQGGSIVFEGSYEELLCSDSLTGQYASGRKRIAENTKQRKSDRYLEVLANHNNLKNVTVKIPKDILTCITGVSGSGKSSLIEVILDQFEDIIVIDQSPIGSSPRSNPATYTKAFDDIRKVFADATGESTSKFAFNSTGACEKCKGLGYEVINMHFLGDVRKVCDECGGKRYSEEILAYKYKGKNISDVLNMTIQEAEEFFVHPPIKMKLNLLSSVGLGYLLLGQSLDTLSGGEAQRVKLASGLSRKSQIYVLDEPTRGLHMSDIDQLLSLLNKLVDNGNTIIVVEHNLDIIKNADWIIDLGPEGGKSGGEIVAEGPLDKIINSHRSYTGKYLKEYLY